MCLVPIQQTGIREFANGARRFRGKKTVALNVAADIGKAKRHQTACVDPQYAFCLLQYLPRGRM